MGRGYLFGCLLSLFLFKFDRKEIFQAFDNMMIKFIKNYFLREIIYLGIILILYFPFLHLNENNEIVNFIVAFLVLDISNSEEKSLRLNEKIKFYESIIAITKGLLCGFLVPLLLILIFKNNYPAIVYFIIYNITEVNNYRIIDVFFKVITIIPSIILQAIYYVIYVFRNKQFKLNFKGEYFNNLIEHPCLNLNIIGSYIENINFYYYYRFNDTNYIKSYGNYNGRIDKVCVKDYLSISYGIAFLMFTVFFIFIYYG